jgi:hypothetical protein
VTLYVFLARVTAASPTSWAVRPLHVTLLRAKSSSALELSKCTPRSMPMHFASAAMLLVSFRCSLFCLHVRSLLCLLACLLSAFCVLFEQPRESEGENMHALITARDYALITCIP